MYKVDAVVRLERLNEVKYALVAQGFDEFAVTDVCRHGSHEGPVACYRGVTYEIPFTQQVRVEFTVPDEALEIVIECLRKAAYTGRSGDGKIFLTQLANVIEISMDRPIHAERERPTHRPRLTSKIDGSSSSIW